MHLGANLHQGRLSRINDLAVANLRRRVSATGRSGREGRPMEALVESATANSNGTDSSSFTVSPQEGTQREGAADRTIGVRDRKSTVFGAFSRELAHLVRSICKQDYIHLGPLDFEHQQPALARGNSVRPARYPRICPLRSPGD